jgi:hypothetical protein
MFTQPDVAYAVKQICLHIHNPRESHLTAMKGILRYLQGTLDYGLLLRRSSCSDLIIYTDADWAGCLDTRRSTSGYTVFLENNLVSWLAKRQTVVSRSSTEAEYHAVANGMAEATCCASCSMSSRVRLLGALSSTTTTSASCTSPPTPFSINASNM